MCGHVGIAGKLEFKDEATMKRLLLIDFLRGPDSTGFAAIRKTGEAKIAKATVNPIDLFDFPRFKEALSAYPSVVFMGHNRAATKGVINNVNAHPYEVDHIVGAHNGTLDASSFKALEDKLGEKFGTDSHAIIAAIARFGIEDTMPLLSGAWSLVWVDRSNNTINFLRNKERPMWFSYTKEFDKILYASEWPMIDVSTRLSTGTNREYELYVDDKGHSFFPTAEDTWYRFDLTKFDEKTKPKPKVKELKGKEPTPVQTAAAYDPFNRRHGTTSTVGRSHSTTTSTTTSHSSIPDPQKELTVAHLNGDEESPFAGLLTLDEFDQIAKYGCSWCQASIDFSDTGITVYERGATCLCADCSGGANQSTRLFVTDFDKLI